MLSEQAAWVHPSTLSPATHHHRHHHPRALQDVAAPNEAGNTALHWACLMGHEAVAKLLLEAGASASALNK